MSEPSTPDPGLRHGRLQRIRAKIRSATPFVSGVLATLIGLLLYNTLMPPPPPLTNQEVSTSIAAAMASATPLPAYSSIAYQAIAPSMVLIQTEQPGADGQPEFGVGSGVVVDDTGAILTSLHVVEGARLIQLTFADGTQSGAEITGAQPENDIAVLHAFQPPAQIVPAILGNPGALHVGDEAFVVGHPLGLTWSMSSGVVSGLDRTFQPPDSDLTLEGLIQIDAAVNPGNSGGPLLNRYGQVVGIITGLVNPAGQDAFAGIGFAVPINVAGGAAGLPPY